MASTANRPSTFTWLTRFPIAFPVDATPLPPGGPADDGLVLIYSALMLLAKPRADADFVANAVSIAAAAVIKQRTSPIAARIHTLCGQVNVLKGKVFSKPAFTAPGRFLRYYTSQRTYKKLEKRAKELHYEFAAMAMYNSYYFTFIVNDDTVCDMIEVVQGLEDVEQTLGWDRVHVWVRGGGMV